MKRKKKKISKEDREFLQLLLWGNSSNIKDVERFLNHVLREGRRL